LRNGVNIKKGYCVLVLIHTARRKFVVQDSAEGAIHRKLTLRSAARIPRRSEAGVRPRRFRMSPVLSGKRAAKNLTYTVILASATFLMISAHASHSEFGMSE
jgi:hypothetical protein